MDSHESNLNALSLVLNRKLVFVHGKGGVGKTTVSQAIALELAQKKKRTLWVTIEDPTLPQGKLWAVSPNLWHLNCDFFESFQEYAAMKIGSTPLTQIFLKNKLMRYLAKAAPGVRELVLLGKIWFEQRNYDHVIVDMPSTGYGLAMFQSTENFIRLFQSGPLYQNACSMMETFKDPHVTGHLIVALPEEMPLLESLELNAFLKCAFPENSPGFLVNRTFPQVAASAPVNPDFNPNEWKSPIPDSMSDYIQKRSLLEAYNLRLWNDEGIHYGKLAFIPPSTTSDRSLLAQTLAQQLQEKSYI